MALYTLEYAKKMLDLWCDAQMKIAGGAAQSYKIGSRELTYYDLSEIQQQIDYWSKQIGVLEGTYSGRSTRQVVFRD